MANNDNRRPKKEKKKTPRLRRPLFTGGDLERKKKTRRHILILPSRPPRPTGPQPQSHSPSESSYAGFNSLKSEAFWFTGDSDTLGHAAHFPPIAPAV